jgi:SAM-dependent methyltransferase
MLKRRNYKPILQKEKSMSIEKDEARERTKEIQAEFAERGDVTGWFDALYKEAEGDNEKIPWADLEPNKFLKRFAEETDLKGGNRKALVVGCGLGDDARFLYDLGFDVTAFDISKTAVEWARKIHHDTDIRFLVADLFNPPNEWYQAFDFVLEGRGHYREKICRALTKTASSRFISRKCSAMTRKIRFRDLLLNMKEISHELHNYTNSFFYKTNLSYSSLRFPKFNNKASFKTVAFK